MQGELDSHHLIHFTYDPIKKEKKRIQQLWRFEYGIWNVTKIH
jgi:hypothetical protein